VLLEACLNVVSMRDVMQAKILLASKTAQFIHEYDVIRDSRIEILLTETRAMTFKILRVNGSNDNDTS